MLNGRKVTMYLLPNDSYPNNVIIHKICKEGVYYWYEKAAKKSIYFVPLHRVYKIEES